MDAAIRPPGDVQSIREEAFGVVRDLMARYPGRSDPVALMGRLYNHLGDTSKATEWWNRAIERNPKRGDIYHALASVDFRKGEFEQAARRCRKAIRLSPELDGIRMLLARTHLERGEAQEAIALLREEVDRFPESAEAWFWLGQACRQAGQHREAAESYAASLRLVPDHSPSHYGMAVACSRLGRRQKAAEHRQRFAEIRAEETRRSKAARRIDTDLEWMSRVAADIYRDAGQFHLLEGAFWSAEKHWIRAGELDPNDRRPRQQLVELYLRLGRAEEAAAVCEQLREIAPDNGTYHLNAGVIYAKAGQFDRARQALRRALELDPENVSALRALVQVFLNAPGQRDAAAALRLAERLAAAEPDAFHYQLLAQAHSAAGDARAARDAVRQGLALDPDHPDLRRMLRSFQQEIASDAAPRTP